MWSRLRRRRAFGTLIVLGLTWLLVRSVLAPLPTSIRFEGHPNWLRVRTSKATVPSGLPGAPSLQADGLYLEVLGPLELLAFASKAWAHDVKRILVDEGDGSEASWVDTGGDDVVFQGGGGRRTLMSFQGGTASDVVVAYPTSFWVGSTDTLAITADGDTGACNPADPSLFWRVGGGCELTLAWTERGTPAAAKGRLTPDFYNVSPEALLSLPGYSLSRTSARAMCCRIPDMPDSMEAVELNVTPLFFNMEDGRLSIGDEATDATTLSGGLALVSRLQVNPVPGIGPFSFAISPAAAESSKTQWLTLGAAADSLSLCGPDFSILVGHDLLALGGLDDVAIAGTMVFSIVWQPPSLATVHGTGIARSCKRHGREVLKSWWTSRSPDVRGGIVGGLAGALLTALLMTRRGTKWTLAEFFLRDP